MKTLVNTLLFITLTLFASAFDLSGEQELRQFDREVIADFQENPAFDYSTEYAVSDSIISLILAYIIDKLNSLFTSLGMELIWPYIFRVLIVLVLLAVVYFIVKNRYGSVLERDSRRFVPVGVSAVHGEKVDYDQLINESKASGDYKLAIRYAFLKCLNELQKSDQIKITTWKAPLDYVDELPAPKQTAFADLVEIFEITWYGDYEARVEQFEESYQLAQSVYQ